MAPLKPLVPLAEDAGLWAGIIAATSGAYFAITGRSRERVSEVAVEACRKSGEFVLAASQDEINANLQDDVKEIKDTVGRIYDHLIGG